MLTKNKWFQLLFCFNNANSIHTSTGIPALASQLQIPEEVLTETLLILTSYGYIWKIYTGSDTSYQITTKGKRLILRIKEKYNTQLPIIM